MFTTKTVLRVLPVHIIDPRIAEEDSINIGEEFESLINTFGAIIAERVIQKLEHPHNATYIGSGKVAEIAEIVKQKNIDVVILNAMVKPGQLHEIKKVLEVEKKDIEVWDRVELILRIFDKHAASMEAKLQIELARMNYMGPRIYGMGLVLSRQGGGIGTSGIGETNTELMRRHWRNEKKKITDRLEKIGNNHEEQLARRREAGLKTISIVGYTNAGKSSLFNLLSKKQKLEKDELFATLDSSVGKIYLPELSQEVLVTDTIGFIRDLPPLLVSAFKSTLMESVHADLLLHVIDISDPEMDTKITVVNEILATLGIEEKNVVFVFNKMDAATDIDKQRIIEQYSNYSPLFISVKNREGLEKVLESVTQKFSQKLI